MIFLIHYDRSAGAIRRFLEFSDRASASRTKLEVEIELLGQPNGNEVVLLEADSKEELLRTHSRYFSDLKDLKIQN